MSATMMELVHSVFSLLRKDGESFDLHNTILKGVFDFQGCFEYHQTTVDVIFFRQFAPPIAKKRKANKLKKNI